MPEKKRPNLGASPYGAPVNIAYAYSTEISFSGVTDRVACAANRWSTLADAVSSLSPRLKPRRPGPISPPGAKPAMAKLFGSCERFAYRPCSTSDIAGLNAASPALAPPDDG